MKGTDRRVVGSYVASFAVVAGSILTLVSLTVDDADLPRGSGGAWARATFTAPDGDAAGVLVVTMSARGDVAVSPGADERLLDLYEDGARALPGAGQRQVAARRALDEAVPQSLATLAIYLAVALLVSGAALALGRKRLWPAWSFVGAGSVALLVTAVLLRQLTVGELGSWAASTNLAELDVQSTAVSARPVIGSILALAGALAGALLRAPDASGDPGPGGV